MLLVAAVTAVVIIFDILSKNFIAASMYLGQSFELFGKFVSITFVKNTGSAYNMFSGKTFFLIILTVVMMLFVCVYLAVYLKKMSVAEKAAIGMVLGGGIGNLYNRIALGYVIDFIDIHIIPVFNVADIGITVGCILLAVIVLFFDKKEEPKQTEELEDAE